MLGFETIIEEIKAGLVGNPEKDLPYVQEQIEKYKDHELSEEITKECFRLLIDNMPEEKMKAFTEELEKDAKETEAAIKEIKYQIYEKNPRRALVLCTELIKKIESGPMPSDDNVTTFLDFSTPMERILYSYNKRPEKRIMPPFGPYGEIYFLLGNTLIELGRTEYARTALEKALRWNPASCDFAFEYIETFKMLGELDEFFRLTVEQFKYSYTPYHVARCLRNLGYYFIEKGELTVAYGCYMQSLRYEDSQGAAAELYYIQSLAEEGFTPPSDEEITAAAEKYGYPNGPHDSVIGLLYEISQECIKDDEYELAAYYFELLCDLTGDEEMRAFLEQLKAHAKSLANEENKESDSEQSE